MKNNRSWLDIVLLLTLLLGTPTLVQAKCKQDSVGYVWCSEVPAGGIETDSTGNVKCGKGECLRDNIGSVYCSKVEGGGAAKDSLGMIKCLGGCERGEYSQCIRADN